MHVYVHLGVWHLQKKEHNRINRGWNNIAVRLNDRVLDEPVANKSPVHEDVNRIAVQFLDLRLGNKSAHAQLSGRGGMSISSILRIFLGNFCSSPWGRLRQSYPLQGLHGRDRN